jgi:hypothetical protein
MPIQKIDNQRGNRAKKRIAYGQRFNRYAAFRDSVIGEPPEDKLEGFNRYAAFRGSVIGEPPEDKLEELTPIKVRQANRRKTDAATGQKIGDEFRVVTVKDTCSGPMMSIGDKIREDEEFAAQYAADTRAAREYSRQRQARRAQEMAGEA